MDKILLNKLGIVILILLGQVQFSYTQCNISTQFFFQSYFTKSANDLVFQSVLSGESIYGKACNGILYSPLTYNEVVTTTLDQAGPLSQVTVSPNPFTQTVRIDWHKLDFNGKIEIFNSLGIKLWTLNRTEYSSSTYLDASHFLPGFYVICFSNLKYNYSIKLVKL